MVMQRHARRRRVLSALLAAAWAPGCRALIGGTAEGVPPDSPSRRIDPNSSESPWAGVGSLSIGRGVFTGATIDPRHVLTAAHVVAGRSPGEVRFNLNYGADLSHRIDVQAIFVHPEYAGFKPHPRSGVVHDDLALLRLSEAIPFGVPIYDVRRAAVRAPTVVTLVGYGASGDGVSGVTVGASATVKRVGRNVIDVAFRGEGSSEALSVYLFDFDGPDVTSNRFGGSTLGNAIEATVAGGDSGSPALVPGAHGRWQIVGVNTFVAPQSAANQRFGGIGGGVLVYGYAEWIDAIIAKG